MRPDRDSQDEGRQTADTLAGYRRRLWLARAVLFWERLWPALWPPLGIAGLTLVVALFDLLPLLPGWLHAGLLAAFALAFLATFVRGLRHLRLPETAAARRRLERDSGLAHRPLASLEDELATGGGDPAAMQLWVLHRQRLLASIRGLRLGWPRAGWAAVDRFALRALLGLLLIVALTSAGADWQARIGRAASPDLAGEPPPPPLLQAWLDPPAYTGQPPLFLDPTANATAIRVPFGTTLLSQVEGIAEAPSLAVGNTTAAFEKLSDGTYKATAKIEEGARITIAREQDILASWPIEIVPDTPPTVEYLSAPGATQRNALSLHYRASDDYGMNSLQAVIHRQDLPEGEPLTLDLTLPSREPTSTESTSFHDLTPHPWAGIPVTVEVVASDALGQQGRTERFAMVLPQRIFNHPVAQALVELRRQLTLNPRRRHGVARALAEISARPAHFFYDVVVSLGLASAERRLILDRRPAAVAEVQELLWNLALRIEDGEVAVAEREMRELQQQLMDALANDAPQEEIERLMNELQEAMNRFLQALAEKAMEESDAAAPDEDRPFELPEDSRLLQSQDLQRMLEQARDLARAGQRDAAQQLLSQLQQMLENLQAFPFSKEMNRQLQQAREMMRGLEGLIRDQQQLLDETFRRAQNGHNGEGPPQQQPGQTSRGEGEEGRALSDSELQEALRRRLGELMRELGNMTGNIPRPLGNAERSMREAVESLTQGQPGEAIEPQANALDQLQQGLEVMLQNMQQQIGQGQGGEGEQLGEQRDGRDPLGRENGGSGFAEGDEVQLPDQMELRRAREILHELRRRSSETFRPRLELDYIDRLLRQF